MVYVAAGAMHTRLGRRRYDAGPGDLVLMPPGVAQDYRSVGGGWEWLWAHFGGRGAAALHREMTATRGPVLRLGLDPLIRERFRELTTLDTRTSLGVRDPRPARLAARDDRRTDALLVGLIGLILHRLDANDDHPVQAATFDDAAVRRYILDHLAEPIRLPALSHRFALSTAQFSRLFGRAFGTSPMRYITRQRIDHAADLLLRTRMKLAAVAAHVGYDDVYHFSRVFKQVTGVPPSVYRKNATGRG